jgi:hypothetical protein
VSHRAPIILGQFTGQGNDLRKLLCRELRFHTRSWSIRQNVGEHFGKIFVVDPLSFCIRQTLFVVCPSSSPPTRTLTVHAKAKTHFAIIDPVRAHQNDPATLEQTLGSSGLVPNPLFENGSLPI